ncbi:MAG: ferrochelatase [Sphingomonadales bacterium]
MASSKKIAVVLFNLGGPDSPEAVKPFLFNLFNDKAIISLPQPIRFLLAKVISARRAPITQKIYEEIGGKSPLLEKTKEQARALEKHLTNVGNVKTFIAMRYWHPFSKKTARQVQSFSPDKVILVPLYPQFSTTTTGSSIKDWQRAAKKAGLKAKTSSVCCYPTEAAFIRSHANLVKSCLLRAVKSGPTQILFTAHGLPKKIVDGGDPYPGQVGETVNAVVDALKKDPDLKGVLFDHTLCYQSRVGPLEWIGPTTENEIKKAGSEKLNLVVVPISFVSEHSETLVELDIENKKLARAAGVKNYYRVPALGTNEDFIKGLGNVVKAALDRDGVSAFEGTRFCPAEYSKCPCQLNK